MTSQFRQLNKPQFLDKIWNLFMGFKYSTRKLNVYHEFGSQLYRFHKKVYLSDNVYLKRNSIVGCANPEAHLSIGENTSIGFNTIILSSLKIEIGANCMVAPNVYITDSNHGTESNENYNDQENILSEVRIGDNVWLGAGVIVLAGVVIDNNVIVGAGSVVTKSIYGGGVYCGNPAKKIRN